MKILVDTNVLISAFIFRGHPRALIYRLLEEGHTLIVTSYVEREFIRKLRQKWPDIADGVYEAYQGFGFRILISTGKRLGTLRDEKDIPILSDALYYDVDVILTGDRDFLEAGLEHPAVMSPAMLWEYLDRIS